MSGYVVMNTDFSQEGYVKNHLTENYHYYVYDGRQLKHPKLINGSTLAEMYSIEPERFINLKSENDDILITEAVAYDKCAYIRISENEVSGPENCTIKKHNSNFSEVFWNIAGYDITFEFKRSEDSEDAENVLLVEGITVCSFDADVNFKGMTIYYCNADDFFSAICILTAEKGNMYSFMLNGSDNEVHFWPSVSGDVIIANK